MEISQLAENKKLNCLIIDINKIYSSELKFALEKMRIFNNVIIANDFQEAGYLLSLNNLHAIFLNISIIHQNEFNVINELLLNSNTLVGYSSNPIDAQYAFDIGTKDFFILPINIERVQKSIFRVLSSGSNENNKIKNLLIKCGKNFINLKETEIQYIEAFGNYIKIYTHDELFVVLDKISTIEQRLSKNLLIRVHRSYIVNLCFIFKKNSDHLILNNKKIIPIGYTYKITIEKKILEHLEN